MASNSSTDRPGVLGTLSPKTRALGLIALIVEALFLAGAYMIPENQRIYAFAMCAGLLVVALLACVWLELGGNNPTGSQIVLPRELEGTAVYFDPAGQHEKGEVAAIYRTASNFKFAGRFVDAIEMYKKVVNAQADHWKAHYNIGSCLMYSGDYSRAKVHFMHLIDRIRALSTRDGILVELLHGCFIQLNKIYDNEKEYKKCEQVLLESLVVKPDDALSYLNLALLAAKTKRIDEARKWYTVLLKHPEQWNHLEILSSDDRKLIGKLQAKDSNYEKK